jgi:cytochrome b pre-mRNA-processing protein 3
MAGVCGRDETEVMTALFSFRRRRDREAAERLYAASVTAARDPVLYTDYRVPDTLQGRFEMVALHLFPLLHRLMHDPGDDPELARLISESFVADMDAAFREMGVGDIVVPKRMNTLYRSFAGRISAYNAALGSDDGTLAATIARNVFPDDPDGAPAAELAAYVRASAEALRRPDLQALRQGEALFSAPPPLRREKPEP